MLSPWSRVGSAALALALCLAPRAARANPCPCRDEHIAGRHLFVSDQLEDVRIASETLTFQVQRSEAFVRPIVVEVSVDYTLVNRGAARQVVIGFPVSEESISSFQARGDGVGARVVPEAPARKDWVAKGKPTECEVDADASDDALGEYYDWFLWKQTLRPGETKLHVRYLQRLFVYEGAVTVHYVLQTARHWGDGRIGSLHIELRDPDRPSKLRWKATPRPTERRNGGRLLVWSLTNHRPTADLELQTKYIPDPDDEGDD